MSTHEFRDHERAIGIVADLLGDREKAEQVIEALGAAGVEIRNPIRQFGRQYMGNGSTGFIVEDVDWPIHAVKVFGERFHTDDEGMLRLAELKYGQPHDLGKSKVLTLGMLDQLCRRGDGTRGRYWGYTTVNYTTNGSGRLARIWVDGREVDKRQFVAWLSFDEAWDQ